MNVREFAVPVGPKASLFKFLDSLPEILAGQDLRDLLSSLQRAKKQKKAILWGIGGHVIKVGLGPVLIDLMRRGYVSGIAMNGAALIHDFEVALVGSTSEDVQAGLGEGQFGMAEETGKYINEIAKLAHRIRIGYGEAAGQYLASGILIPKHSEASVLMSAYRMRIPVTVHLAIGTDITHIHPTADGAALGTATQTDFRLFCSLVGQMDAGGAFLNWGSAVVLPEIFLKAVSVVRNLGVPLQSITTANFDFIQHYRPTQNIVKRPTAAVERKWRAAIPRICNYRPPRTSSAIGCCGAGCALDGLEEAWEKMIPNDENLPMPVEPDEKEMPAVSPGIIPPQEPPTDTPDYILTSEQKRLQAESHFPPDLQISWFWVHGLVFGAFIVVSFVVMQIVVLLSLPAQQRTKAELAQEYLLSHPVLSIGSTIAIFGMLLFFLYMTLSALPGRPFWKTLGWRKIEPKTTKLPKNPILYFFMGGAASLLVALLTTLLHAPDNTPIVQVFHHRNTALLFLAVAVLIAPLVEETLFRGYLYPLIVRIISAILRERGVEDDLALHKGIISSIAFTGLLFGLMHGPQLGGALSLIAVMSLVGILFTLVRAFTGSVLASFMMHLGYNSLISVAALISTRGFTKMPPGH